MNTEEFKNMLLDKGQELYRDMPWRSNTSPYYVMVSELMLQQTQVNRVVPKFEAFIYQFPNVASLADAPLSEVLKAWSGLGYNRRAKYLHGAAKTITSAYGGNIPADYKELQKLPGIGAATAGAIMVYAFNQPVVFIETNVRTVYLYHFFEPHEKVSDGQLMPLIEATIDTLNPRAFYWALMDYGTYLKLGAAKTAARQSSHYKKQSAFSGSVRQVRGQILRAIADEGATLKDLEVKLEPGDRLQSALEGLLKDGLISQAGAVFYLTK